MQHTVAGTSARLTKRFAILGGLIIVAASVSLVALHRQVVREDLEAMAEHNNIALTRTFSNVIWPRYAHFLGSAHQLGAATVRTHGSTAALRRDVLSLMRGLSVVKVKIYDLGGLTVFSTDPGQIGEDKRTNAGFVSARSGRVASELTHRDTFSAFEQVIENRDVLSSYVPIQDPSGALVGVFEVYYDVTALLAKIRRSQVFQMAIVGGTFLVLYLLLIGVVWRSARQDQRRQEEAVKLAHAAALAQDTSRMKSDFLAHMSHELRTPLNAVLGFSESLKKEIFGPVGSPKYLEYADDILASGQRLLAIINDVLDMAKVDAGRMVLDEAEFDPVDAVRACIHEVEDEARRAGIRLEAATLSDPPRLFGDERRVRQIVLNLLSNAVKFTPPGGAIDVVLEQTSVSGLAITVADTGLGIPKGEIERVLAPFGQADNPYAGTSSGTGLGLAIAKSLAGLHGASFVLDSELGGGTRARIEFPPERLRRRAKPKVRATA